MRFSTLAMAAAATSVSAQRPEDTPICDYYTKALLKENNATNQATLLTLLVNTVVIGNYTMPNVGVEVAGILAPGEVDGEKVNLLPYFSGELASTNRGGDKGVSVNFLDSGGAEPLMKNKPANEEDSEQYALLTHLYQFFGALLGCTQQGMTGFDAYSGDASMYEVHKFMALDTAEVTYFIQQVGMAAASFGVAEDDITTVATTLGNVFNVKCGPATTLIKAQGAQLQSICIADDCKKSMKADCGAYDSVMEPSNSTATMTTAAPTATGTMEPTAVPTTGAAVTNGLSLAALAVGVAAFAL